MGVLRNLIASQGCHSFNYFNGQSRRGVGHGGASDGSDGGAHRTRNKCSLCERWCGLECDERSLADVARAFKVLGDPSVKPTKRGFSVAVACTIHDASVTPTCQAMRGLWVHRPTCQAYAKPVGPVLALRCCSLLVLRWNLQEQPEYRGARAGAERSMPSFDERRYAWYELMQPSQP